MKLVSLDCLGLTERPDERRFLAVYDVGTYEVMVEYMKAQGLPDLIEGLRGPPEFHQMMNDCTFSAPEMHAVLREIFDAARGLGVGQRWRLGVGVEPIPNFGV